jgi:hypothetical protein
VSFVKWKIGRRDEIGPRAERGRADRDRAQFGAAERGAVGVGSTPALPAMRRIEHSVWLEATPEAAYDYMTTLRYWCRWYSGAVAMEGQTDAPSVVGDTVTEHVRALGVVGKLRWITVESARPRRFVVETTAVEMPLMRRARLRLTYAFEPPKPPLALHTRMVRTLEYEFTGVVRVLDRVYLHEHLKRKTAFALTKLQGLVRREAADGSLRHAF